MKNSREPTSIHGARALIFDRLTQSGSETGSPPFRGKVLDMEALKASVAKEVGKLLSTRCHSRDAENGACQTGVIQYGAPDFSHLSSGSEEDLLSFARVIAEKIQYFEPRLQDVRVKLAPHPTNVRAVIGAIDAKLRLDRVSQPVSFPLFLDAGRKDVTIE